MKEIIAITVRSELGYYKKFSSNTSPLTYLIPPKTALLGFLGALVGEFSGDNSRDVYLNHLSDVKCSVKPLFDFQKSFFGLNYQNLQTKKAFTGVELTKLFKGNPDLNIDKELVNFEDFYEKTKSYDRGAVHTQVNAEFLMKPKFIFFFEIPNESIKEVVLDRLEKGESYYPLFMGTSDCPLEVVSYDILNVEEIIATDELVFIDTSFLEKDASVVSIFKDDKAEQQIYHEKQPFEFVREDKGRRNKSFVNVIFSLDKISVKVESYLSNKESGLNLLMY